MSPSQQGTMDQEPGLTPVITPKAEGRERKGERMQQLPCCILNVWAGGNTGEGEQQTSQPHSEPPALHTSKSCMHKQQKGRLLRQENYKEERSSQKKCKGRRKY